MNRHQNSISPHIIILAALMVLLSACGGSKDHVYDSLDAAKRQAAKKDTWIVVEFWRHG